MNSLKYFFINNKKFNYDIEFQNKHLDDYWKHNAPLIEYCENLGITIPHYCYHKHLSISGNCRMCLVELKNAPKPMVSCAMSAKASLNNSEIFTDSPLVKKARENILEFLLLNHPLDCPICDQGGECDLQDQSLYFGSTKKRFYNYKRIVTDKNIGKVVKTVMTRCIHCTRCVRFSTEIAGTEDLGMFGRGLDSEIGTYVSKAFQSELSGNVIDLCPVGALTAKPYPFLSRSWELKTVDSIDYSDGSGTNIQVSIKNNIIVKVTPSYELNSKTNPWISDKARFSFDGMFSPDRIMTGLITFGSNNSIIPSTWKVLINEMVTTLYFQDHLNNHFMKNNKLIIVFSNNISLEVLNLITLLSKKYSFITLRKFEGELKNNDFECNFITNMTSSSVVGNLYNSTLCLLIGLNSRLENVSFNLNLRKRYLKGDFQVINLGSNKDLTFPTLNLGLNLNNLQTLIEGNSFFCRNFINSKNPLISLSSSHSNRKDYNGILLMLIFFKTILKKHHKNWNNLNIINTSLNEVGINYLKNFKSIAESDFKTNYGFYFLNAQPNTLNIKKLIKLKLLNYNNMLNFQWPMSIFEQNFGIKSDRFGKLNNLYSYINLPSGTFFESTGTFINTNGEFRKSIKFISTKNQTKEDWQILRKLISSFSKVFLLSSAKDQLAFNTNKINKFSAFNNFMSIAVSTLTNKVNMSFNNAQLFSKHLKETNAIFKTSKCKIFSIKLKSWLNDFYIGGLDSHSKSSANMINCSKSLRSDKINFSHLA